MTDDPSVVMFQPKGGRQGAVPQATESIVGGNGGGHIEGMSGIRERLAAVEEAIRGLRHSQNLMIGAIFGGFAIMIALGIYGLQRIDTSDKRLADLPGQINQSLMDLTATISESITAAKQQAPQVILLPAPQPAPPADQPKKQ